MADDFSVSIITETRSTLKLEAGEGIEPSWPAYETGWLPKLPAVMAGEGRIEGAKNLNHWHRGVFTRTLSGLRWGMSYAREELSSSYHTPVFWRTSLNSTLSIARLVGKGREQRRLTGPPYGGR